ncbi:MAG: exodeoxyribonuclease III [Pseudomonadota bacterium]
MRIISFSAGGVREAEGRGLFEWLARQDADFICIQDLRCSEYDLQDDSFFPTGYNAYFFDDIGGQENGVAVYCKELPKAIMTGLGFSDFDMQGRYIQADYGTLSVGCLLAPVATDQSSQDNRDSFFSLLAAHLEKIRNKRREYIICGDWGIAPALADIQNPELASNGVRTLPHEREWLDTLFDKGYADAFRIASQDSDAFTFWPSWHADPEEKPGQRSDGYRIDLQVISDDLQNSVEHAAIYTGASFSAHAPVIVDYDIEL